MTAVLETNENYITKNVIDTNTSNRTEIKRINLFLKHPIINTKLHSRNEHHEDGWKIHHIK